MDKNTGDQLNRAYEAYRQACMDKERFKKELQQKTALFENQLLDKEQQIACLKKNISFLTMRLLTFSEAGGGFNGPPTSPKLENSEGWKSETASLESLQEQLKVSQQREKLFEDQLDIEKLHVLKLEGNCERLESDLASRNEEIQYLKKSLKEAREMKEKPEPRAILDSEIRNTNTAQDPSAASSALSDNARLGVERIFSDLKEEFSRICKLTREQSSQLNTFLMKKEMASGNGGHLQFSMPVQCTDEENEEAQILHTPKNKTIRLRFPSITPRGLGTDDELSVSVESLSNLSIKFPPSTDESDFLESAPGKPPIFPPAPEQKSNPNKQLPEAVIKNLSSARSSPPYSPRSPKTACHQGLPPNYRGSVLPTDEDSGLVLAGNNSGGDCKNTFHIPDTPDVDKSTEITERTVRGPQQPIWKPSSPHDNDLSILGSEKWDQEDAHRCEFCQAVFPPSSELGGDFLRHLSTHF